ncbi:transposase [Streptosporangium sp. NPDC000396]|uniref:transposase n=1 Tax=Streptosporangium sp. NPDC000396 TaxID=3366185 RepID=UPI0036C30E5F
MKRYKALALLAVPDVACQAAADLQQVTITAFRVRPDHAIVTSFPGLGELTGARLFAEIGDDRTRFADAHALQAYAGAAPITRASGRSRAVVHRRVKNRRLAAAGCIWAFASITVSPAPEPTMTGENNTATGTPRHCVTSTTASSAACSTACKPAGPTTSTSPSPAQNLKTHSPQPIVAAADAQRF